MTMKKIMVVGAGQMGSGIAQVCEKSNVDVILHEENEDALKRGMKNIAKWLSRSLEKKQITKEEKTSILMQIQLSTQIRDAKSSDIIIEAVTENITIKSEVLRE